MTTLNEYLTVFDKVDKRIRDEKVTELLPRLDLSKRADFEGDKKDPPKKVEKLEKALKKLEKERQFKSVGSRFDEEHNLWEVSFVNSQGAEHILNWELMSSPEARQLISKYKQIEENLEPPFIVEVVPRAAKEKAKEKDEELAEGEELEADKTTKPVARKFVAPEPVEKSTPRELFDYVIGEGRKEYTIQRYKGLGEMTSPQLWETTMDPERRTLLSVRLEDIAETETIFSTLMGEDVEARRKFIEENALDVKNLDI